MVPDERSEGRAFDPDGFPERFPESVPGRAAFRPAEEVIRDPPAHRGLVERADLDR